MQIYTNNAITIDGKDTGLSVTQGDRGTVVYTPQGIISQYKEHAMPHARYSLSHPAPASGVAGRDQFEADIRALIATL